MSTKNSLFCGAKPLKMEASTNEATFIDSQQGDQDGETIEFKYYNASGVYIGKSNGESPEPILYKKAHYVIQNDSDMIKNLDPVRVIQRDIKRYREELLNVPISNMDKIMELNHLIQNLEQFLNKPKQESC